MFKNNNKTAKTPMLILPWEMFVQIELINVIITKFNITLILVRITHSSLLCAWWCGGDVLCQAGHVRGGG